MHFPKRGNGAVAKFTKLGGGVVNWTVWPRKTLMLSITTSESAVVEMLKYHEASWAVKAPVEKVPDASAFFNIPGTSTPCDTLVAPTGSIRNVSMLSALPRFKMRY